MDQEPRQASVVLIPTWRCNCTCAHCFERLAPISAGEGFLRLFFGRMRELAELRGLSRLVVYWQGGEVLVMDPREVARGLRTGADLFRGSGTVLEHHLQTNLLPYSPAWRDVIGQFFSGSISSSLDFPNAYRAARWVSREQYADAWMTKKAEAEADGFTVSVVTLPNPGTLEAGAERFFRYFRDEVGVRNLQVNFPFPGVREGLPARLDPERLADFMCDLYETWVESGRSMNLNPFVPLERRIFEGSGPLSCAWSYSCAEFLLSVGPDGEVGQCDCWLSTQKQYRYGDLSRQPVREVMDAPARRLFLERPGRMIEDDECGTCPFWSICYGGCPVRAYLYSGDLFTRDYYCPVYRRIFSAVFERRPRGRGVEVKDDSRGDNHDQRSMGREEGPGVLRLA